MWLVILISLLLTVLVSVILIWGLLVFITILGAFKLKSGMASTLSTLYYYSVQELAGFIFLLSLTPNLSIFCLLVKGGFAPFHIWILKVLDGAKFSFVWIMSIQKLPYYLVVSIYLSYSGVFVIFLSTFIPLLQGIFTFTFTHIYFYVLTASGNLMLACGYWDIATMGLLCPLYLGLIYSYLGNYILLKSSYELIFVIMGFPINIPFFIKLLSSYFLLGEGSLVLVFFVPIICLFILVSLPLFYSSVNLYYINKSNYLFIFIFLYLCIVYL